MIPVLIVDDSHEDIALLTRVLWQCKIRNPVFPLPSGEQCIAYFERSLARGLGHLPCLVLLDLSMSPKSGIDVLKHLSTSPRADTTDSVFVMLSGVSDYSIVREGYQLGATTFLTKPVQCDELLQMLRSVRGIALHNQSDGVTVIATKQGKGISRPAPTAAV